MTEIYIDGIFMDTDDKVGKIAVTYQNFVFLSLDRIRANYTNRISLPLTTNNRLKLDQMAPLSAISTVPYTNHSIRIVQAGIEIIPSGVCQITGVQDRIEIDVQSGIKGFFDALEGFYLNDLDLSAYNGNWGRSEREAVRSTTSGLICPVVETGESILVDAGAYTKYYATASDDVHSKFTPFFYYHTLISMIATFTGFTFSGSIFSEANHYLKMILACGHQYDDKFINDHKVIIKTTTSQSTVVTTLINFETLVIDLPGYYNSTDDNIVVQNSDTALDFMPVQLNLTVAGWNGVNANNDRVEILKNGSLLIQNNPTFLTQTGAVRTFVTIKTSVKNGDIFEARIVSGTGSNVGITSAVLSFGVFLSSETGDALAPLNSSYPQYYYFNNLLPRIALKDFIKDFMKMFGLVCSEENNIITFKTIEEVLTGLPTTSELLKENKKRKININYALSYPKTTFFKWIIAEIDTTINSVFGRGEYSLTSVPNESSFEYESLFTASQKTTIANMANIANINVYNHFTTFGYRLLMVRANDGINVRYVSGGTSRTDYLIAYFIDPKQQYSLDFQEFINQFYGTYIDVLNNYAAIEQEFLISQVQSVSMDLLTTKHKQGITYLVEQVSSFVPGKFAKFKMIRILIGS